MVLDLKHASIVENSPLYLKVSTEMEFSIILWMRKGIFYFLFSRGDWEIDILTFDIYTHRFCNRECQK